MSATKAGHTRVIFTLILTQLLTRANLFFVRPNLNVFYMQFTRGKIGDSPLPSGNRYSDGLFLVAFVSVPDS